MQETLFDRLSFPFRSKPVLVAGMAMQLYGLHEGGHDDDWIVSPQDFQWVQATFADGYFNTAFGDEGVKVGSHEFSTSLFGYCYCQLVGYAIEQQDHLIVHLELLLFLTTLAHLRITENAKAKQDISLHLKKPGVWPIELANTVEREQEKTQQKDGEDT